MVQKFSEIFLGQVIKHNTYKLQERRTEVIQLERTHQHPSGKGLYERK